MPFSEDEVEEHDKVWVFHVIWAYAFTVYTFSSGQDVFQSIHLWHVLLENAIGQITPKGKKNKAPGWVLLNSHFKSTESFTRILDEGRTVKLGFPANKKKKTLNPWKINH